MWSSKHQFNDYNRNRNLNFSLTSKKWSYPVTKFHTLITSQLRWKKNFITLITHTVFTENKEAREGLFSCLVHTYGLGFFTRTCVYKTNAGISTWIFKPVTEKHAGITEVVRCMRACCVDLYKLHSLGESIGSLSD